MAVSFTMKTSGTWCTLWYSIWMSIGFLNIFMLDSGRRSKMAGSVLARAIVIVGATVLLAVLAVRLVVRVLTRLDITGTILSRR